jgi:4-carboxymuconolactone decarboxylase
MILLLHIYLLMCGVARNLQMSQRSMITVALLAALGRDRELARHIEGALRLGITSDEIIEIMLQVAHYAGWPAGHNGQRVAQEVFVRNKASKGSYS